jgi:hypothetical protein
MWVSLIAERKDWNIQTFPEEFGLYPKIGRFGEPDSNECGTQGECDEQAYARTGKNLVVHESMTL